MRKNSLNWFEIPAIDLDRAIAFYNTVVDGGCEKMTFENHTMGVFAHDQAEGVGGAVFAGEGYQPSTDGTVIYLNTDIDTSLPKVSAVGGQVLMPKTAIGSSGFIALILDTEGNKVGFHSMQ